MSEQRSVLLQRGLIGGGALAALILLASFYSVVSGAVEQAVQKQARWAGAAVQVGTAN